MSLIDMVAMLGGPVPAGALGGFVLGVVVYLLIDKWIKHRAAKKAKNAPPPF